MISLFGMLTPPLLTEYIALIPGLIVTLTGLVIVLLSVSHRRETSRDYLAYISSIGLGAALASSWVLWDYSMQTPVFHGMLYLDRFGLFFSALCAGSGILGVLMAPRYLRANGMDRGEYYILVVFSVAGMIFMANAADLLSMFIALEIMSIPLYCLAAFMRRRSVSAEAGLKYFILGAFSAGLLLYGIAIIYGLTGTTNLEMVALNLSAIFADPAALAAGHKAIVFAMILILSAFGLKIAAVPFHFWTPDVYTGSPTPLVGFMATAVKAAAFAALVRVFVVAFYQESLRGGFYGMGWIDVMFALSLFSIILGNLVAIAQTNVKRMLAYSSIAHTGYILVGLIAANSSAEFYLYNDTILFYILAYSAGTLGAFGALSLLRRNQEDAQTYDDLNGLGFKYPVIGLVLTICMLSSAGIPPTAGFLGKFYVFRAAVDVGARSGEPAFIYLAIAGVLMSVAGMYYYLRVIVCLYMKPENKEVVALTHGGTKFALVVAAFLSLYFGLFPQSAIQAAREAVVDMKGAPLAVMPQVNAGRLALEPVEPVEPVQPLAIEPPPTPRVLN